MKRLFGGCVLLVALAITGIAPARSQGILQATIGEPDQKTPEVSTDYVRRIIADRSAFLIDTRPHAEFVNGHIPGANNPTGSPPEIVRAIETLVAGDKTKELILYCNGPYCQASRRLAAQLQEAGFANVRRYQLGLPIWRALGGPTEIDLAGATRIYKEDQTAVFLDARAPDEFAKGSLPRAQSLTPDQARTVQGKPMPLDDFNTRIVVFGGTGTEARALADALSKRPWHNVTYFAGSFAELSKAAVPK